MNDHECVTETTTEFLNQVSFAKTFYIIIYVFYYNNFYFAIEGKPGK